MGEVAEEKVEGEISWAHLIADTDHSLAHLRSLLHEQCNSTHRFYLSFHQSLSELEVTLSSRSLAEASARRSCLSIAVGRLAGEGRE